MGDRFFLEIVCPQCGATDKEVYYAPTCGVNTWTCTHCQTVTDLEHLTGITYAGASNRDKIASIVASQELPTPFDSYDPLATHPGDCDCQECHEAWQTEQDDNEEYERGRKRGRIR